MSSLTWMQALKKYNRNNPAFCIPVKGSNDYNKVIKLMKGEELPKPKKTLKIVEEFKSDADVAVNPAVKVITKRPDLSNIPVDLQNYMGQFLAVEDKANLASVGVKVKMTKKEEKESKEKSLEHLKSLLTKSQLNQIEDEAIEVYMLKFYKSIKYNYFGDDRKMGKNQIRGIISALKNYTDFMKKNDYPLFTRIFSSYIEEQKQNEKNYSFHYLPIRGSDAIAREEEGYFLQSNFLIMDQFLKFVKDVETTLKEELKPALSKEEKKAEIDRNKKNYFKMITYLKKIYKLYKKSNQKTLFYENNLVRDFDMEDYENLKLIQTKKDDFYILNTKTNKKYITNEQIYSLIKLVNQPKHKQQKIITEYQNKYDYVKENYS